MNLGIPNPYRRKLEAYFQWDHWPSDPYMPTPFSTSTVSIYTIDYSFYWRGTGMQLITKFSSSWATLNWRYSAWLIIGTGDNFQSNMRQSSSGWEAEAAAAESGLEQTNKRVSSSKRLLWHLPPISTQFFVERTTPMNYKYTDAPQPMNSYHMASFVRPSVRSFLRSYCMYSKSMHKYRVNTLMNVLCTASDQHLYITPFNNKLNKFIYLYVHTNDRITVASLNSLLRTNAM